MTSFDGPLAKAVADIRTRMLPEPPCARKDVGNLVHMSNMAKTYFP